MSNLDGVDVFLDQVQNLIDAADEIFQSDDEVVYIAIRALDRDGRRQMLFPSGMLGRENRRIESDACEVGGDTSLSGAPC